MLLRPKPLQWTDYGADDRGDPPSAVVATAVMPGLFSYEIQTNNVDGEEAFYWYCDNNMHDGFCRTIEDAKAEIAANWLECMLKACDIVFIELEDILSNQKQGES